MNRSQRARSPRRILVVGLCLSALALMTTPATAQSSGDPTSVPWTELLPPTPAGYEDSASPLCPAGQTRCVDVVIREMTRRFNPLASRCDHDAVFALTYLRTTEEYRRSVSDPAFFSDTAHVNHQDVVFAHVYFRAFDAYHRRNGTVPPAWQVAFEAADSRSVSGSGNLLLGINAHVNRDLPFVLAQIGIATEDGDSRKPDHDQVNQFLIRVTEPLVTELSRRFDASIDDSYLDGTTLDETTLFQLMAAWREGAWRNAERLVNAPSPEARERVANEIEDAAEAQGRLLALQYSYIAPLSGTAERDAFCAANRNTR